ncbi:thioredoxin family protein [Halosegnis sp.]|uniref:thioredoxin family protein n=1 Tax=Halosegnis sp. TaxID=2864959 RepID=UPI0035D4DF47
MSEQETDMDIETIREQKLEKLRERAGKEANQATPDDLVVVDSKTELSAFVDKHRLVVVDFHADWCGPCEMQEPILEALAAERDVAVATVDVDRNQPLASAYDVRGIPALIIFADGEPVERLTGVQQRTTLDRLLDRY